MKKLKRTLAWLLVLCMVASFLPASVFAAAAEAPKNNLTTTGSPFQKGTGESNSFRIPALVTLSDGTLVAAADARWNTTYDGGGLDTMVAISKDNGANWTHSFANYLGDNGNEYNGSSSTCFIDPALTVVSADTNNDGVAEDTIYMLVDLYPYGIALNGSNNTAPSTDTGFTDDGYLKLDYNSTGTYGYYLKDGEIYANGSSTPLNGYTVDAYFNVTNENTNPATTTNLFYADSIFKVARTGFLYLTKSTDKGATWSAPQLLNLKNAGEQVCLVGPGRGAVVYNNEKPYIIFPVYSYNSGTQRVGFIYSADGTNWERSENLDYNWGSESAVVELWDNTLRFFFRNGSSKLMYVDYTWTGGWGEPQTTGIATNSNTQISAISLQKTIDDQQVILVSCPAGPDGGSNDSNADYRTNGKIFLFTVDENNAMTKKSEVSVPSVHSTNSFMYSCMTALTDNEGNETGDIAILYEDQQNAWGTGDNCYYQMSYKTFDLEDDFIVTLDEDSNTDVGGDTPLDSYENDVTVKLGETFTEKVENIYVESDSKENDYVTVSWTGTQGTSTTTETLTAATLPTSAGSIECYISDGNGNYLSLNNGTLVNVTDRANATKWTVTYYDHSNSMARYKITSGGYYVRLVDSQLVAGTEDANNGHYYTADKGFFCSSNGNNVWVYNNGWTLDNTGNNAAKAYTLETVTEETAGSTTVTITGKKAGQTTVELGNGAIRYNITIEKGPSVDVQLKVNETKDFTIPGINLEDSIVQQPAEAIADMTVTYANDGHSVGEEATTLSAGQYLIFNTRASKLVNNTPTQNNNGRLLSDTTESFDAATAVWTITPVTGGYTIQDANGKYMRITNGNCTLEDSEQVLTVVYTNGTWTLMQNSAYLNQHGGGSSTRAAGWQDNSASTDSGSQFRFYPYTSTPASTTVSFTGKTVGRTTAVVGDTTYNITVLPETTGEPVNVELEVGESKTLTDNTGNYENNISLLPDTSIATVVVTGSSTSEMRLSENVTAIESGKTYAVVNTRCGKLMNNQWADASVGGGGTNGLGLSSTKDNFQDNDSWTITVADGGYYVQDITGKYLTIAAGSASLSNDPVVLSVERNGDNWVIFQNGQYLNNYGNANTVVAGYSSRNDQNAQFQLCEITETVTSASTEITFTGVAPGTTTAVVGNTLYNITVTSAGMTTVDIELEIGESFTYTDTTGNHVDKVTQEPDGNYATMAVSGSSNSVVKKLVPVTASTFQTGKRYVIENVRTVDPDSEAYQPTDSVLTSTVLTYGATGLDMNGPLDANSSQTWTFTPNDNMYYVGRDNSYITISNGNANMSTTAQSLSFEYVDGSGWLIYYNADGNNTSNDGDYFLSDLYGKDSGEAFGIVDKDSDGNYWNIYEVVDEQQIDATKVTFTGVAEGKTTAIVGNTQYNITVVPAEVDDEVMNSATDIWTVDPEVQRQRYNTIIDGKYKDLYTDESWKQYEAARQAAYKKLVEVTNAEYSSKADAEAALAELETLVDALDAAAKKLVAATTISVHYTYNGTELDIREYKIASSDTSVTLPDTIVVGDIAYKVTDTTLERQGAETTYYVPVTLIGKVGEGFVGSEDIKPGELTYNDHSTVCDLVDNNGGKKITEMTVTVGISYNLDLGIEMLDGYTVEWVSDNTSVATVDQEGNVTAVGDGIANITATVKDAAGNIVEVNSIPVNVYPKGTGDRTVAVYIENIDNTTVWCVINANTNTYGFEVIEGELIYGQFDTTVTGNTQTTAMSFFGDPDEAHALVYMKSTNSDDHYFLLHDDKGNLYDGTVTPNANYYVSGTSGGAGWWQALGLNDNANNVDPTDPERWQIVKDMVQWAIDLGCDGGLGFTRRQNEGALGSNLSFVSNPMPRIEKEVDGVLPTTRKQANYRRYVDDMVAAVHELVYFKITVTQELPISWKPQTDASGKIVRDDEGNEVILTDADGNPYDAITYSSAMVTDTVLPGAYLYTKALDQADGTWDGEIAEGVDENGIPFRKQYQDITDDLNGAWTAAQREAGKRVFEFYLLYEIQESDIPKFFIDNIANLDYNYQSHYSKGAQAAAADAEARISVVGSAIDNVVIDFGQSFTYEGHEFESYTDGKTYTFTGLTNVHLKGAFVDGEYDENGNFTEVPGGSGAAAKYGDVKVYRTYTGKDDDKGYPEYIYTVEYTPTAILQEADAVRIYGIGENDQEKMINGFLVYPATTVYYEEGFLEDVNGWSFDTAKKATTEQTFELLGVSQFDNHGTLTGYVSNKKHAYGFDPIYDEDGTNDVVKSSISSNTAGDVAKFTFTGTGFEIFADCTENSGYVNVAVNKPDGSLVKMFTVNTVVKGGTGENNGATSGQTGNMDALPIVSLKDLEHGTYTVTLTKVVNDGKTVTIDGVRITNTVSDSSIYTVDLEDSPEFYQLRDSVMNALDLDANSSADYGDLTGKAQQVYNDLLGESKDENGNTVTDTETPAAVITDVNGIYGDGASLQDLLDNGPKNEIYLWPGQTLSFNVATQRVIQVGLKAPRTGTDVIVSLRNADTSMPNMDGFEVNGATDMFYYLSTKPVGDITNTYLVSITNDGKDILAITDLKVCDDPTAALVPLTLEDVTEILRDAGYTDNDEPEAPLPFVDVPADAYYYDPVAWAVKEGITSGISETRFGPDADCSRAQVVTFLWRAAGEPEPTLTSHSFVDVESGSFYEKAVLWAVERGITAGTDSTHFSPNASCSRVQVVTFLYRAFESPAVENVENPFSDVPNDAWYTAPVLWAVEQNITAGTGDGLFDVNGVCSRAQIVTFLYRAYN